MKDLNSFLYEEDKAKDKAKAKPVKEGEGADDQKFILLMESYKRARGMDKEGAAELLKKAIKLAKSGDVSPKARLAAAYI